MAVEPFAVVLVDRGYEVTVVVPDDTSSVEAVVSGYAAQVAGSGPPPLVIAHSNAGNYIPGIAAESAIAGVVFVDAVLPPLGGGQWQVVPADLAGELTTRATDGVLPRWTRWWPRPVMQALFPSAAMFDRVDEAAPEIDASYLTGVLKAPAGWAANLPAAYLAFGDTYSAELNRAAGAGWPNGSLDLGHLGILTNPETVADAMDKLLETLGLSA
jgi:hypothetical protein